MFHLHFLSLRIFQHFSLVYISRPCYVVIAFLNISHWPVFYLLVSFLYIFQHPRNFSARLHSPPFLYITQQRPPEMFLLLDIPPEWPVYLSLCSSLSQPRGTTHDILLPPGRWEASGARGRVRERDKWSEEATE